MPWQVLPYERQLEVKREQVDEALRRIGGLEGFELEEIMPAVEQWRYRNKLEYSFGSGPGRRADLRLPRSAGARRVAPIDDCLLASERGNRAREIALAWCREQGLAAWERGRREQRDGERERGGRRAPAGRPRTGARACATWSSAKAVAAASCRCVS